MDGEIQLLISGIWPTCYGTYCLQEKTSFQWEAKVSYHLSVSCLARSMPGLFLVVIVRYVTDCVLITDNLALCEIS